jgi:hypothetical protein
MNQELEALLRAYEAVMERTEGQIEAQRKFQELFDAVLEREKHLSDKALSAAIRKAYDNFQRAQRTPARMPKKA